MDRYELATAVIGILEAPLSGEGYDLLDVRIFRGGGRVTVRVFLDREGGINIQAIARASRTVGYLLEEADLIEEAYFVEVSSPGVRRPLRLARHYEAAVGQEIILKLKGLAKPRMLKGRLLAAVSGTLDVQNSAVEGETQTVLQADVLEGYLDPELDVQALINADRRLRKAEKQQKREQRRQKKT